MQKQTISMIPSNVFFVLVALSSGGTIVLFVICVAVFAKHYCARRNWEKGIVLSSSKASTPCSCESIINVKLLERLPRGLPRFNVDHSYAEIYRGKLGDYSIIRVIFKSLLRLFGFLQCT